MMAKMTVTITTNSYGILTVSDTSKQLEHKNSFKPHKIPLDFALLNCSMRKPVLPG